MERCGDGGKARGQEGCNVCVSRGDRGQRTVGEGQQTAEVRGPERRDVVELCLQAMVTQRTVALCVSSFEFVMGYHCRPIIKQYLHHFRQLVNFSGSVTLQYVDAETTKAAFPRSLAFFRKCILYKQGEEEEDEGSSVFKHSHTHPFTGTNTDPHCTMWSPLRHRLGYPPCDPPLVGD